VAAPSQPSKKRDTHRETSKPEERSNTFKGQSYFRHPGALDPKNEGQLFNQVFVGAPDANQGNTQKTQIIGGHSAEDKTYFYFRQDVFETRAANLTCYASSM
jgi:hypothetical protein